MKKSNCSRYLLYLITLCLFASGCAIKQELSCNPKQTPMIDDLLYFGSTTPDGVVSASDWNTFLGDIVTPAFPQGLTHWTASGQWQRSDESILHENSYILNIIHPYSRESESAISNIISEYKSRYHQQSVLRVKNNVCVSF